MLAAPCCSARSRLRRRRGIARPQPVDAAVRRSGDSFVAEFTFPRSAAAWGFFRSAPADADKQLVAGAELDRPHPRRRRSQRRGRYDALVGARRTAGPAHGARADRARSPGSSLPTMSRPCCSAGAASPCSTAISRRFRSPTRRRSTRFGVEPPDAAIGDGGTSVRFVGGNRPFRLAGDVAGYRRGNSSGTYGLFDVPRARVSNGIATVIDSEMPAWLAAIYRQLHAQRARRAPAPRLGPSGIAEPTVLAAWEGAARNGASMNGGTLKGLILMRLEGEAALAPNPALRDMARWFIAHEAAHFWLGQAVSYEGSRDSWIMEGGADLLAARTVQRLDPSYSRRRRSSTRRSATAREAAAQAGRRRRPSAASIARTYACGAVFALVAERASGGDFYALHPRADRPPPRPRRRSTRPTGSPRSTGHRVKPALAARHPRHARSGRARPQGGGRGAAARSPEMAFTPGADGTPAAVTRPVFEHRITARPEHIDELGHVNNAVWVQWIQEVALAHWYSVADPAHQDDYIWVVVRHEIDYLRAVRVGETVTGRTWVGEAPKGARFDRLMEFVGDDGKVRVRARTTWAIIDKAAGPPDPRAAGGHRAVRRRLTSRRSSRTLRPMSRIVLHDYYRSSASYRVRIALGLKGLDYERREVNLAKGDAEGRRLSRNQPAGLRPGARDRRPDR